jgi:hypothetical protein
MANDTIINIILGAFVLGILAAIYVAVQRRRLHAHRLTMMDLLKQYFQGDLPIDQLGRRIRELVSRHFIYGTEFYSLTIAAFQGGVDAIRAHRVPSKEDERKLMRLLAALKEEFGLTDLFKSQEWRPGRE